MAGFVAAPPPLPEGTSPDLVEGDGFYPALSVAALRDSMRINRNATDLRIRDALRGGMASVWVDLAKWQAGHIADGAESIADVPASTIDGESALAVMYRRAVFSYAAADLVETHNDISATGDGRGRIESREMSADDHRRNAIHAVRDILGVTRTTVELI